MKAAVLRAGEIVVDLVPDPVPEHAEVVVRTLACGICGSDLHARVHGREMMEASLAAGETEFGMDLDRDVVMGHEYCAEVVDFGPGCQRVLSPGTRVCGIPLGLRHGQAATVGYHNDLPGGFGEYMVLREETLVEVPNGLATEYAALTEPLAVGRHAVALARLQPGDTPLVVGCGPVGLAVIAALRLAGAEPIVAADFSPRRRELAALLGADVVVDPAAGDPIEPWAAAASIDPASVPPHIPPPELSFMPAGPALRPAVIFECVGTPGMIDSLMRQAPRSARIVVVGVCMQTDHFRPLYGINKELSLQFTLGSTPAEFKVTLEDLAAGRIGARELITGTVGLDGVRDAFRELESAERHAKILVEP